MHKKHENKSHKNINLWPEADKKLHVKVGVVVVKGIALLTVSCHIQKVYIYNLYSAVKINADS